MKRAAAGLLAGVLLAGSVLPVHAELLNDEKVVSNMTWKKVWQNPLQTASGNVQGLCSTEDYIIMIENVADNTGYHDVVTSYYKNDHDAQGNPVEQYSIARQVQEREWEHGNGMAYNPNTGEIYVALYTNTIEENRGCLYVMDPETLAYKGTVKVADSYNILGIDYLDETDQYLIQTNADADYSFKLLDSEFNLVEDYGPADISPGANSQDLCVVEDYIINSPCGGGFNTNVYSISGNRKVATIPLTPQEEDMHDLEIESFTELEPGHLLMVARKSAFDGWKYACFYETYLPVETLAEKTARLEEEERAEKLVDAQAVTAALMTVIKEDTDRFELEELENMEPAGSAAGIAAEILSVNVMGKAIVVFVMAAGLSMAAYAYHIQLERKRRRRTYNRRRAVMELQLQEELEMYA